MIKPPSLQKQYTLIFSGDPALDLPEVPDAGTDEEKREATEKRALALKNARDTGNWPLKPGEHPTLFHFEPLNGTARDYIEGECHRKNLSSGEFVSLMFRLGLRKVDNLGDAKVELEQMDGFKIATTGILNFIRALHDVGDQIVVELGALVAERTRNPLGPLD